MFDFVSFFLTRISHAEFFFGAFHYLIIKITIILIIFFIIITIFVIVTIIFNEFYFFSLETCYHFQEQIAPLMFLRVLPPHLHLLTDILFHNIQVMCINIHRPCTTPYLKVTGIATSKPPRPTIDYIDFCHC